VQRLLYVIAFTPDLETMKAFYRDRIGLPVNHESQFWVDFETGSDEPALALIAVGPDQKREIELCFESKDIETSVATMRGRGVQFIDEIRDLDFGRLIHLRDPEGNLLSLLQPKPRTNGAAPPDSNGARGASVAVQAGPRLRLPIVNCRDMAAAKSFYRDQLGLHLRMDSPWWTEYDAGPTRLALHPRVDRPEREGHHGQGVTIGFTVDDLIAWADEARTRDVHFTSAPADEGWGLFADATDPEGYELTFREPEPPRPVEEELAEAFEDDRAPQHAAIRKSVKQGAKAKAVSRVAIKPEYKSTATPGKSARTARSAKTQPVRSARGTGPAGSRVKPKRAADPKRARNRPAIGRLKKAERRTLTRHKTAVASASKGKPVKRPVAKRGRKR
jgi:predicted enzyme related to lactoylglutathione lyase